MSERRTRGDAQGTPKGRAARQRAGEIKTETERSILRLSGAIGFRQASVAAIAARGGMSLFRFYETFAGKDRCYAQAYDGAITELSERLLAPCSEADDWIDGVRGALIELTEYIAEDRCVAAGVVREVHVVGGPALTKRGEVVARLSHAVDRARYELEPSGPHPPPSTSLFVVESIEAAVIQNLTEGGSIEEALPGLLFLAISPYFGAAAARRAVNDEVGDE